MGEPGALPVPGLGLILGDRLGVSAGNRGLRCLGGDLGESIVTVGGDCGRKSAMENGRCLGELTRRSLRLLRCVPTLCIPSPVAASPNGRGVSRDARPGVLGRALEVLGCNRGDFEGETTFADRGALVPRFSNFDLSDETGLMDVASVTSGLASSMISILSAYSVSRMLYALSPLASDRSPG